MGGYRPDGAVVLKSVATSPHHGVLGVARSLGRLGVDVHVASPDPAAETRSRYVRGWFPWSLGGAGEQALEQLEAIGDELGSLRLLVAVDDSSTAYVDTHAERLAERFVFQRQPHGLVRALSSKRALHDLCLSHDVPTPRSSFPTSYGEAEAFAREHGYPVVVKRSEGWRPVRSAGAASVAIVRDAAALRRAFDDLDGPDGPNAVMQEYIPGGAQSIWMFNGYFDDASDCLFHATGQKIRQAPPHTGATTLGVCRANDEVATTTQRLFKALGYHGVVDLGYRFDERDGAYKLLDVNPRVGSTFRLFATRDGLDVVRCLYSDVAGDPVPRSAPAEGRTWMVEDLDLLSSLRYHREGSLPVRQWLSSVRGVDEVAWFARDDLGPPLALLRSRVAQAGRRPYRRRSGMNEPSPERRNEG
ncbi:MAG: carboxylate--amine ligase [Gaiellaceae bacterium]|jgi:D-aspartate ligase